MREAVARLWPETEWIQNVKLRSQVTETWIKALERSPLKPDDLNRIPFTLLVPNCPITFMEHKRCVVHIARQSAQAMQEFMGRALPIDIDTVIAGAILADVGKLLEYEIGPDGKSRQSERGEALRHPFTGVALALECGVPDAVCHIIAAHAAEGDLVKRTTEAYIVLLIAAQGAAYGIEQKAFRLVHRIRRQMFVFNAGGPARHLGGHRLFGYRHLFRSGQSFSYFTLMFFGFLNGKNAMKSAWCTM